jgi:mitochondrial fission protein ELM1
MVCEGCATGKPVHVVALDGGSAKFARFHAAMQARGYTRPFDGTLGRWSYPPLDETARVAAAIRARASRLKFPDPKPTTQPGD